MVATKRSWTTKRFWSGKPIAYSDCFSAADFARIRAGLVPEVMEDKWFIYFKAPYLFFHRSWTGRPIFRLRFAPEPSGGACVAEALYVPSNAKFSPGYAAELVGFLIDGLLLGKSAPYPVDANLDFRPIGLEQHHSCGTAHAERRYIEPESRLSERPMPHTGPQAAKPTYRYLDLVMAAFVVVLICSNLIGPAKAAQITLPLIGPVTFGAGVLFFPISYIFGDVLTEVYGYARARRVIWAGFAALIFASLMAAIVVALPPAPGWENQKVYEIAYGNTWRIAGASMLAYFCGEFVNSFVLAKMKVASEGAYMRTRFVASTVAGEAVDSALFYPLAFFNSGIMPNELVLTLVVSQFVTKTLVEIAFLPVTTRVVDALKRAENEDYFDRGTDFSPFKLDT